MAKSAGVVTEEIEVEKVADSLIARQIKSAVTLMILMGVETSNALTIIIKAKKLQILTFLRKLTSRIQKIKKRRERTRSFYACLTK